MPQPLRKGITVTGASGFGIRQTAGSYNATFSVITVALSINSDRILRFYRSNLITNDLNTAVFHKFRKSISNVDRLVTFRKHATAAFNLQRNAKVFKKSHGIVCIKTIECTIQKLRIVRNIGKQLAPFGVTLNNLSPGVSATPRNDAALSDEAYREKVLAGIPAGYAGKADDCAGGALLLCSDEGRYITGIDLVIDGGMQL